MQVKKEKAGASGCCELGKSGSGGAFGEGGNVLNVWTWLVSKEEDKKYTGKSPLRKHCKCLSYTKSTALD